VTNNLILTLKKSKLINQKKLNKCLKDHHLSSVLYLIFYLS